MRLAFVVGSPYEMNGQLPVLTSAELDSQYLARRLALDDIGATVVELPAERGMAERLEQALSDQTAPIESVLVAFVGYAVFSAERGPALLLDGDRLGTFSFIRLRSLLERYCAASCVMAEVMVVGDGAADLPAVAQAIGQTLTEKHARGTSGLLALRQSPGGDNAEPVLPSLVTATLDWLSASGGSNQEISIVTLFEALRNDERFRALPVTKLVAGNPPFLLVRPNGNVSPPRAAVSGPLPAVFMAPAPPAPAPPAVREPAVDAATGSATAASQTVPAPPSETATLAYSAELAFFPPLHELSISAPNALPAGDSSSSESEAEGSDYERVTDREVEPAPHRSVPPPLPAAARERRPMSGPPPLPPSALSAEVPAPRRVVPPPLPLDAAALFHDGVGRAKPGRSSNGRHQRAETAPAISSAADFRGTVAVASLSERYGEEPPPSDALPSFGGMTIAADELLASGELEGAAQEYQAVLVLMSDDEQRGVALARLARALCGLGRADEAESRYAEAVALAPRHSDILQARATMDDAAGDHSALLASAEAWLRRAPEHPLAIGLLEKAADATGDTKRAIEARRKRARHLLGGAERAAAFLDISLTAEKELGDEAFATALALEGLELAPSHLPLLDRARGLFERSGRAHELLPYYERAMSQILDPDTAVAVAQRIEQLAANPAADPRVAVAALERLVETRPAELGLRYRVADLYTGLGDAPRALAQVRLAARVAPANPDIYRRVRRLCEQLGNTDTAWNACSVLEALGEAELDESLLAGQHRLEGLPQVRGVVSPADFAALLLHEDEQPQLRALGAVLGTALDRVGLGYLRDKKRYFEPDPATLQDPEKSTTMLAKTLGWSSRLLGLELPELHVLPDMPAMLEIKRVERPLALAGRSLGSGLSLNELAFLWGRQLPRLRPEFRVLSFFKTRQELTSFMTAVLGVAGARGVDVKAFDRDTKRSYAALKRELKGTDPSKLKATVAKVPAVELPARVERLIRSAELTGVRAGLLLCGDVGKAAELIVRYPTEGLTRAEDQLAELYQFAISDGYSQLRQRLGIGV